MNTPIENAELQTIQAEVERQFGACLLRLQGYELLLKAVVSQHHTTVHEDENGTLQRTPSICSDRKTLGTLVGHLLDSVLTDGDQTEALASNDEEHTSSIQFVINLRAEDFARIETDLRQLVTLRNNLVHHFLTIHDLNSLDGCVTALASLSSASTQIKGAKETLKTWVRGMEQAQREMAQHLTPEAVQHFVRHDRFPWPNTAIVQALLQAEAALSEQGWTPVAAAILWISEHYPDERPAGYRCRSWRQVIHETGLFELQYRHADGERRAWFRSRG